MKIPSLSLSIDQIKEQSGVAFGTSGARGLVRAMTDQVCMAYTTAFLQSLRERGELDAGSSIFVGGDRRPSTPRIMAAVCRAIAAFGCTPRSAGMIPSPALALWGMREQCPTVMVTGSHIPDDRNGMKFTTARGEITKADEARIVSQTVKLDDAFDEGGMLVEGAKLPRVEDTARKLYLARYVDCFGATALRGVRLGIYGHSAVGRDLLLELYQALGARCTVLGMSETFVPVDTEAIREADVELAAQWATAHELDAILSTDGDSDRPLTSDEKGRWLRGDVSGIITAAFLRADAVALPVSCNTALEKSGLVQRTKRTKIGSPYVIAALEELAQGGAQRVVGYEANGGFFIQTPLCLNFPDGSSRELPALPTRDPVIVHLAVLLTAKERQQPVSALLGSLPARSTASGRDASFERARSLALLEALRAQEPEELSRSLGLGPVKSIDETDGLRITLATEEVLHLRPSGNAPELRCYGEAETEARAAKLVEIGLALARRLST